MDGNNVKKMRKMANSLVGYIALLRSSPSFAEVGSAITAAIARCSIMAYMDSRGWGEPTPPIHISIIIYIYIHIYLVYTIYTLLDLAPPNKISGYANGY